MATSVLSLFFVLGLASQAHAAVNVYYSVGQNTTDHKTGSPTVTISGNTATFSVAQTATNMGVGDKVTYGTVGVVYISGKQSTTVWDVTTATGTVPVATTTATVNSIAHAFARLNDVFNGGSHAGDSSHLNNTSLVAADVILHIPCYYDTGPDTTPVVPQSLTTDSTRYVRIYTPTSTVTQVNQTQRHSGIYTTTKYRLEVTDGFAINNRENYIIFDGLQVKVIGTGSGWHAIYMGALSLGANRVDISNNLIVGSYSGAGTGHGITPQSSNDNVYIYNNIIYGFSGTSNHGGIYSYASTYAYNNTLYNNGRGLGRDSGTFVIKNNIAYNNTSGGDYTGTFSALSTHNLSKDTTAPALNTYYRSKTLTFTNTGAGTEDLHLVVGDTDAIGKGTSLSTDPDGFLSFVSDINGSTRSGSWSLGADQYVDNSAPIISSVASSTADATSTITWTTNENATSSIAYGLTQSYGNASSSQNSVTSHSISLSGLSSNTVYHFQISSTDDSGNTAVSGDFTFTTAIRSTPPIRSAGAPSGTLSSGTLTTALTLDTDEDATCKYSTTSDTVYASMTNTFDTTGGTNHSQTISVAGGHFYDYYVRCQDIIPNTNPNDYQITFNVASSGTVYAESCSYADVQAAVTLASSGDTVVVPAGGYSGDCTWSSVITINKPLSIIGAGSGAGGTKLTTTNATVGIGSGFFNVTGLASGVVRISGFYFEMVDLTPFTAIWIDDSISTGDIRIDHNTFNQGLNGIQFHNTKGLIDHNYFYNQRDHGISYQSGSTAKANASWVSMAVGTIDPLFIEDNYFIENQDFLAAYDNERIGTDNGGKLVFRRNLFDATTTPLVSTFDPILTHGSANGGGCASGYWEQSGGGCRRGQSTVEVYDNIFKGKRIDHPVIVRGSANLVYNNTITISGIFAPAFYMLEEEYDASSNWSPLRTAWPAEDQVHNTFFWNNTYNGAQMDDDNIVTATGIVDGLLQDRDYFLHAPCGASDTVDAYGNVCTHGKAVFTNLNGFTDGNGASDSYPGDGTAYTAHGTMSFVPTGDNAYYGYMPFVYPHPLTATDTMGTDVVDIGAGARIFGTAKFYGINSANSNEADISVVPASGTLSQWIDLTISVWNNTGTREKTWTETSTNMGAINTVHTVGDLSPNTAYAVKVDGVTGSNITGDSCVAGICTADGSGKITFTYTGGYSTHTFNVIQHTAAVDDVPASPSERSSVSSGSVSGSALASFLTPSAAATAYLNSLKRNIPNCPVGFTCTPATATRETTQVPSSPTVQAKTLPPGNLSRGNVSPGVKTLQSILNSMGYTVASTGPGSPGRETTYFGLLTTRAIERLQCDKLKICSGTPKTNGFGHLGPRTRALLSI